MEKKTVFLELPCELLEKIDNLNTIGDRSLFVSELIKKQLDTENGTDSSTKFTTKMSKKIDTSMFLTGEISLVTKDGTTLDKFNINTVEGFENLARKIEQISEDPLVQIRAHKWL
ncbi:MAG: hypothetical protein MUO82_11185 [Candidatus Thermoplasmatota archaeon]|nr:hypothetical protein [Candidatus Thermoplasmatota archaeon]